MAKTLQEWLELKFPKTTTTYIVIKGKKIAEVLRTDKLEIKGYNKLETIYLIDLPELKELIIDSCSQLINLQINLDQQIEVKFVGEFPNLKGFTCNNTQTPKVIIKSVPEEKFCIRCFLFPFLVAWNIVLTVWLYRNLKGK